MRTGIEHYIHRPQDNETKRLCSEEEYNAELRRILPPGTTAWQLCEEMYTRRRPEFLKLTCPRTYETTSKYWSAKTAGIGLATVLDDVMRDGMGSATTYKLLAPALLPLIRHKVPLLWISPELLAAVQRTDFDDEIDWRELKLPYEEGVFILPRNGFSHPVDGECAFIVWTRQKPGDYKLPSGLTITLDHDRFAFATLCPHSEGLVWYDSNITSRHRPKVRLRNLFCEMGEQPQHRTLESWMDAPLTRDDDQFLEGLGVILFGTFLALAARPQLMGETKLLHTVKAKHGRPERQYWKPNILGEYWAPRMPKPSQGGTHATPRFHLRRGHFRNQACGAGWKEHKHIWLEPMWVMPGEEKQ